MLADRIRKLLDKRPYWGPQSVARELKTTPRTIRVTASRHKIAFMDRYELEREMDKLVEAVEKLEVPSVGKEVEFRKD